MKRPDAYKLVDGERDYQDRHTDRDGWKMPLEGELLLLEEYVAKARRAYANNRTDPTEFEVRNVVRMVAAIAVRCMEHHGAPPREK